MKKIISSTLLFLSLIGIVQGQNVLLESNFWKNKPSLEQVKTEIAKGNNPSEANEGNYDVVSIAINNNATTDVVQFLINQKGNSIDKQTHDGRIYLHWATKNGNVELVKYLISKGSSLVAKDDKSATPLSYAAINGQTNPEIYEIFFKAGVKPNETYINGANILHLAIAGDKDLKLANYLSTKGLSLKSVDHLGRTTFDYAARLGNIILLQNLLNKEVKPTDQALIFAAQGTKTFSAPIETYSYLIDKIKLNPNIIGENGETPLHYLVRKKNHNEIVKYFLNKKADVNKVDKTGNNAFMNATSGKELDIVELLLPLVKNINHSNEKGETALHLAVQSGSPEIVSFLIRNNADVKSVSKNGNLAFSLFQAYKKPRLGDNSFEEKLNILKNNGVSLSSMNEKGETLYHIAVTKNDLNLLKSLENKGININAKDHNGMTVLHKAASMSKDDTILKYLLSIGADKFIRTDLDETTYDLAKENEFLKSKSINLEFLK